jgi:hypothetical protein
LLPEPDPPLHEASTAKLACLNTEGMTREVLKVQYRQP